MMDMSSVIDASMVVIGVAAVLMMGVATLLSGSNTVSTVSGKNESGSDGAWNLPKAA